MTILPGARTSVVVLALALSLGATGCSTGGPSSPPAAPPTPIERLDTAALSIPRIDFCSMVPVEAVRAAVGSRRSRQRTWGNGDTAAVGVGSRRVRDVVAEHGCLWTSRQDTSRRASAWIFARPVGRTYAAQVVHRSARAAPHCRRVEGPQFGNPSVTQLCSLPHPQRVRVRHAGLFDRTWLTCQVSADRPRTQVRRLADRWCVAVASALNQNR